MKTENSEMLELGSKSHNIQKLKMLLNIAGYWGSSPINDIVDGELMYWVSRFIIGKSETQSVPELVDRVTEYLNILITPPKDAKEIPVHVKVAPNTDFILPSGEVNPDYLVPAAVNRDPFDVYGKFEDLKMGVVTLPFPLRLSWDLKSEITRLNVNSDMAEDLVNAMNEMLSKIGYTAINVCGLDITGGCYNRRKIRGGTKWSSHSWGTAIDINPLANPMGKSAKRTLFGTDARYLAAAKILHNHGFRTLATDTMHWQWVPKVYR